MASRLSITSKVFVTIITSVLDKLFPEWSCTASYALKIYGCLPRNYYSSTTYDDFSLACDLMNRVLLIDVLLYNLSCHTRACKSLLADVVIFLYSNWTLTPSATVLLSGTFIGRSGFECCTITSMGIGWSH